MPEEINRMVTDSITDYFFKTTETADKNLLDIGVMSYRIYRVGNTMIDTLIKHQFKFYAPVFWNSLKLRRANYLVITLHHLTNVDEVTKLKDLLKEIIANSKDLQLIFPVHPRTAKILTGNGVSHTRLHLIETLSYLEFNFLFEQSLGVITDSGGITEETTVLGIPCITLRDTTERPETICIDNNELIGTNPKAIKSTMEKLLSGNWKEGSIPKLWDGKTSDLIVSQNLKLYKSR
jgi:UDP-N-acetylglucosamine 2-epimerase (non-hydrolysing)